MLFSETTLSTKEKDQSATLNDSLIFTLGRRSERWERSEQTTGGRGVQERSTTGVERLQGETQENSGE